MQAALHGRSTEAEVREILAIAVKPDGCVGFGDALAALSRDLGLTNADYEGANQTRDKKPAEPLRFLGSRCQPTARQSQCLGLGPGGAWFGYYSFIYY
jgi:plasmid stability protein